MREPLVSVIMCVRDGAKYLREALDSVADQDCEDLEVIVIDDGSKDASVRIAATHPLAPKTVSQPPLGVGAALNHGIRIARGRYLSFLDCDDVWTSGRLGLLLAAFDKNSDIDFVFGKAVNTDEQLDAIGPPVSVRHLGALLIKRTSALKIGEFRTDIAHAVIVDWHGRGVKMGLKSLTLDEIVLLRRIHGGNMGILDRENARTDMLRAVRDHLTRKRQ
jgi:glycosyltransferase involved in cell wall biosynthesis